MAGNKGYTDSTVIILTIKHLGERCDGAVFILAPTPALHP
jgi:hypothetical protein